MTCDYVKTPDRVDAIGQDGKSIAYIQKNYIGTHGHWSGWEHYVFCADFGRFVWAGAIQMEQLGHPAMFRNVKQFQEYYAAK